MTRELDSRTSDGIRVQLLWHPCDRPASFAVNDTKTGERSSWRSATATGHSTCSTTPTPTRPGFLNPSELRRQLAIASQLDIRDAGGV